MDSELTDTYNLSTIQQTQIKNFSLNDKKLLVKRINDIRNRNCYVKILKLINSNNCLLTTNNNGVFFNVTDLSNDILAGIDNIITHYENKKNNIIQSGQTQS